jgi:hypothetical protein
MLARALMSFSADSYGISAQQGEIIEVLNPNTFLDLSQAKFVEQVDRPYKNGACKNDSKDIKK